MKVTNALFLERNNGSLFIYHVENQKKIQLNLNKPWVYFPFSKISYLTPIRIINPFFIEEDEYETTPDTLIILNPNILINSRVIASASDCTRRMFIEFIMGESKTTLPMVRGSIIHDAFSNIVSQNYSVPEAYQTSTDKFSFTLSRLSANHDELLKDVIPVLKGLAHSAPTLQSDEIIPEMTFLSPFYGILGRIDYWSPRELYELKSSKNVPSKEMNTWFSDLMQTIIYMHGLSPTPKAVSKSYVIYSGIGSPAFRQTSLNLDLIQRIHMARNFCYLIQYEDYIPAEQQTKKCLRCFKKKECTFLFNKIAKEKNISSKQFHYFNHFLSLIKLEHLKNRQDFGFLWKLSPRGRVKTGKAILNLKLLKKDEEFYEYSCNNTSELRRGEPTILSGGNPVVDTTVIARIFDISQKRLVLTSQNQLPKETYLDAYSSDFNYNRLNKNLYDITLGEKSNHKSHDLIISGKKPTFLSDHFSRLEGLDQSQQEAIQLALNAQDYCLIQGPAGTGKTYTIGKLIEILRQKGQRILLTAYTNTAVDNMINQYLSTTKIRNARKEIVRLGVDQAIDQNLTDLLLQNLELSYQELEKKPVIAATTTTISRGIYDDLIFDTIIVDEASQMIEPSILSAITKGQKFILVGDDKQLPPLVLSSQAEKLGLNTSLFERLRKLHPEASVMLRFQYRMHEFLMKFSNTQFYDNKVRAASPKIAQQLLWDIMPTKDNHEIDDLIFQTIIDPDQPLVYVGIQGSFDRKNRTNLRETEIISTVVSHYLKFGIKPQHIGIIAPFRGQVAEILRKIGNNSGIAVDTIDRYQGSDKELIILSLCTLTRPHILEDERRLNVALTRAKKKMIVVGGIPNKESIRIFHTLFNFIYNNYSTVLVDQQRSYESELETKSELRTKARIESNLSFQSFSQDDINKDYAFAIGHNICILCQDPVNDKIILRCPVCNQAYHENHLREWLESSDVCAICQTKIQLTQDLIS